MPFVFLPLSLETTRISAGTQQPLCRGERYDALIQELAQLNRVDIPLMHPIDFEELVSVIMDAEPNLTDPELKRRVQERLQDHKEILEEQMNDAKRIFLDPLISDDIQMLLP